MSCHSVAVVLTLAQTKQIRINIHSEKSFGLFLLNQVTRRKDSVIQHIDRSTDWTTKETGVDFM